MGRPIKDLTGRIVVTNEHTGRLSYLYDLQGRCLGFHSAASDTTYRPGGVVVGKGNRLPDLMPTAQVPTTRYA
ncbi:MAG: hypothetical protein ACKOCV_00335 [Gemmatimonadota bacterium]